MKITTLFTTAIIFIMANLTVFSETTVALNYAGGDGSSGSPFQISNLAELRKLSETSAGWTGKFFVLTGTSIVMMCNASVSHPLNFNY